MKFGEWTPRPGYLPALSIRQPWAYLIAHGLKDIENRDWPTSYRGSVLIHAGQQFDKDFPYERVASILKRGGKTEILRLRQYQHGGIIGIATLVDVVQSSNSPWFCGPYGFVFKDARPLPFTPCKGALGLFSVRLNVDELAKQQSEQNTMSNHNVGDPVYAEIKNKRYAATVTDVSQNFGYKVELEVPNPFNPGQTLKTKHPQWLPYTKLCSRKVVKGAKQ